MNYKSTTKTDGSLYTKDELCKYFLHLFSLQGKKKSSQGSSKLTFDEFSYGDI